ncbi:unnamed protein product [Trichobilharzia szidati]|nr:unnamed protein product [Trichobilharzia szidati]
MVMSRSCNLFSLPRSQFYLHREEYKEIGGYFIVNGKERVIRLLIMARRNFPLAICRPSFKKRGHGYTERAIVMRCVREDESVSILMLHWLMNGEPALAFIVEREQFLVPISIILRRLQYPSSSIHQSVRMTTNHSIQSLNIAKQSSNTTDNDIICKNIKIIGWVQSVRKHKSRVFCNISDGTSPYDLQVVMTPSHITENINIGCAVSVEGDIHTLPNNSRKSKSLATKTNIQCWGELHAKTVTILDNVTKSSENDDSSSICQHRHESPDLSSSSSSSTAATPAATTEVNQGISSVGRHSPRPDLGVLRSVEGLSKRHRLPEFSAMLRMRARIKQAIRKVMHSCNYLEVDTPILTTTDCEGTGQMFTVQSPASNETNEVMNKSNVFLTGSAQMHLESLALGLSKVYTLNPTFRAENSHTRHHLAEFYMLEAESIHLDNIDSLCSEIEKILKMILNECLDIYPTLVESNELTDTQHDLLLIQTLLGRQPEVAGDHHHHHHRDSDWFIQSAINFGQTIKSILSKPFPRVTYNEAIKYLNKQISPTEEPYDLSKSDEQKVLDWFGGDQPVFITHFPAQLKPFYCQLTDDADGGSVGGITAECTDLLFPGIGELVGGSVRESSASVLQTRIKALNTNHCRDKLHWYIDLRNTTGSVPHGGFGLGFERLLQYLLGIINIRDTIAFPRNTHKIIL